MSQLKKNKNNKSGWHGDSERHSRARRTGRAGGIYRSISRPFKKLSASKDQGSIFKDENGNTIVEIPSKYFNRVASGALDRDEVEETLEKVGLELWEVENIAPIETHGTGIPDVAGTGGQVYLQNALTKTRVPMDFLSRAGVPPDPRDAQAFHGLWDHKKEDG